MRGLTIPIILTIAAIVVAFMSYRGIRRGGARVYTLEREIILRQAMLTLFGAIVLFIAAVGLLAYEVRQRNQEESVDAGLAVEGEPTITPVATVNQFPPTATPTATPDPNVPTVTPTVVLRRALVDGTGGNGLYLRETPGGEVILTLPDGAFVTLLEDEPPVSLNGFNWVKVRNLAGDEGWVADFFLVTSTR